MQQGDEGPDHLVDLEYTPMHQGYPPQFSRPHQPCRWESSPREVTLPTPGPYGGATTQVKGQEGPLRG